MLIMNIEFKVNRIIKLRGRNTFVKMKTYDGFNILNGYQANNLYAVQISDGVNWRWDVRSPPFEEWDIVNDFITYYRPVFKDKNKLFIHPNIFRTMTDVKGFCRDNHLNYVSSMEVKIDNDINKKLLSIEHEPLMSISPGVYKDGDSGY